MTNAAVTFFSCASEDLSGIMRLMTFHSLLDIIFPRFCAGCGKKAGDGFLYLCWDCLAGIKTVQPPYCALCGDPVAGSVPEVYSCAACVRQRPYFDCARSACAYTGLLKEMILDFKYGAAVWLAHDLGSLLYACLRQNYNADNLDCITYVPLHRAKERTRSYNQSLLLAKEIGGRLNRRVAACLARTEPTESQTHLTAPERAANVRNKFAARKGADLKDKNILLIDDVMTTGATVNECAHTLKKSGAREVLVLTVARG